MKLQLHSYHSLTKVFSIQPFEDKMIFFKILFIGLFLMIIGGFAYFALTDIPIHQSEQVETLPASDFLN